MFRSFYAAVLAVMVLGVGCATTTAAGQNFTVPAATDTTYHLCVGSVFGWDGEKVLLYHACRTNDDYAEEPIIMKKWKNPAGGTVCYIVPFLFEERRGFVCYFPAGDEGEGTMSIETERYDTFGYGPPGQYTIETDNLCAIEPFRMRREEVELFGFCAGGIYHYIMKMVF